MTARFSPNFWARREHGPHQIKGGICLPDRPRETAERIAVAHFEQAAEPARTNSFVEAHEDCCLVLPENYEPNYPYPLILWLHGAGGDERDVLDVLPKISMQN